MRNTLLGLIALVALGLGSTEARAQNLIVNGGFESGALAPGWTGGNGVTTVNGSIVPHSGNFFLEFGAVGGDVSTSQIVATVLGQVYDLQFFYSRANGGTPSDLNVYWNGGAPIYSEVNSPVHGWVQYDFLVTGTGSDTLTFGARNDPTWDGLDDVSLTAVSAVPEPATWALIGVCTLGTGAFAAWNKRRRKIKKSFRRLNKARAV